MRTKILLIVLALCLALAPLGPMPRAQDPAPSPASAPTVSLSLIVTDKDGKGLNSISKDQIRVFEEKTEQTVLGIEADERPIDYVILVDSTGTFKTSLQSAVDAAKLFIINRRPEDQVAVVRFVDSDKVEKVQEFSTDGNALQNALNSLYVEGGQSAIIDALYLSAQYVAQYKPNENRRKAIIAFTDGDERISYYQLKQLIQLLYQESVQVFPIGFVTELNFESKKKSNETPRQRAEKLLTTVAEQSGGRVFFPETREQLVASAAEIMLHLRAQFRVKYQSSNADSKPGWRNVEVKFATADDARHLATPHAYWFGPKPPAKPEKKKKS